MKKISAFIKEHKLLTIALFMMILLVVVAIVINGSVDKSKGKEQDVFDRLNSMSSMDSNETKQISLEGENAIYTKIKDVKCEALKNAVVAYDEFFIAYDEETMKSNKVYRYNLQLLFENEENCILDHTSDDKNFKSLLGFKTDYSLNRDIMVTTSEMSKIPTRYYGNDPQLPVYYFERTSTSSTNHYIPYYTIDSFSQYRLNNEIELIKNPDIIYQVANAKAVIKDNIMYKVRLEQDYITIYDLQLTEDIVFKPQESDEIILKVFTDAVITNKRVYVYGISDDSCLNYVDRECEKGFVINEDLTKRIDDIAIINSAGIVFKDGSAYLYENTRGEE